VNLGTAVPRALRAHRDVEVAGAVVRRTPTVPPTHLTPPYDVRWSGCDPRSSLHADDVSAAVREIVLRGSTGVSAGEPLHDGAVEPGRPVGQRHDRGTQR
jgi:hypothetical protein